MRIISLLFILVVGFLVTGFVLMNLWGWIVCPAFGFESISLTESIGVSLIISYLKYNATDVDEPDNEVYRRFAISLIADAMFLLMGWVVSLML